MEQSKKTFLKNMVGFSMVTWISFVLGFIASPIATRLFPTEEMGRLNLFNTYAALISSICYLGLDQAFVRFFREVPGKATRRSLFTFCISTALAFSVLSTLVLSFFWKGISAEIVGAADMGVFVCLGVYSFSLVVFRFLSLCYRMEQNAVLYTIQGVLYALFTKIAYLAVGFTVPTGKAALMALTILMGLFTLVFVWLQRKRFDVHFLKSTDKAAVVAVGAFALPLVPISLLAWLNSYVSPLVLKHLLGYSATGIYTSALGLASTINIIQTGFNAYWAPYVLENYQSDDSRRFYTVHRLMACMLTLFGLGITLLQTPVFLLLGKAYRSSVVFFPFLFLSPICYCLGETTGMGVTISKKSYWNTLIYLFSGVINVILCFVFIPLLGMAGAALASATSAVLTLLLRTYVGERYYRVLESWRYLIYTIGLMALASFGNLWLTGVVKYALLVFVLLLACFLYRRELKTLWTSAMEILSSIIRKKGGKK